MRGLVQGPFSDGLFFFKDSFALADIPQDEDCVRWEIPSSEGFLIGELFVFSGTAVADVQRNFLHGSFPLRA